MKRIIAKFGQHYLHAFIMLKTQQQQQNTPAVDQTYGLDVCYSEK